MDIVSGTAANILSTHIIAPLIRRIDDVILLDDNRRLVQEQLNRLKVLLRDISYQFDNQQKSPPDSLKNCVERMQGAVGKARELIESSQRPHQCFGIDCAFLFKPRLSTQIRKWTATFNGLFDELRTDFSVFCSAQQIASLTPRQAEMQIDREVSDIWVTVVSGTAANILSTHIIASLIQRIDDVILLDDNRLVQEQLNRMKVLLRDISYQFDNQRKSPPDSLKICMERMHVAVVKARELIESSQRPHQCFGIDCAFLFKLRLSTQIRKWTATFNGLFAQLQTDFSVFCSAQQIASFTPRQAETQIERWLAEARHVRRIGVYGRGGVGKTALLKKIYNTHKQVSDIFDAVIWVTVAQYPILELQGAIASQVNLDLTDTDVDVRKMKLRAYLKDTNFLLVLDDMYTTVDLEKLGVEFNNDRVSKIIFSSGNRNLIEEMKAEVCIKMQAMSTDEGWNLFSQVAFKEEGDHIPEKIEIVSPTAVGAITVIIIPSLIQQIDDVILLDGNCRLDGNRRLVQEKLNRAKGLLCDISYLFDNQQTSPPDSLRNCVERMEGAVGLINSMERMEGALRLRNCVEKMERAVRKVRELIKSSQRPRHCFGIDCAFLFRPRLSRQIKEWTTTFHGLFTELLIVFSLDFCSAQHIASFTPRQAEMQIERWLTEAPHVRQAEKQMERCLTEAPYVRRIGVYGTGGVGKTTLLKKIYNTHKEVSDFFDAVIWVTVAQYPILELQAAIASEVNLDLTDTNVDVRKMKLRAYLKDRNFLLVLEDMWTALDLEELGVEFNNERVGKLIFSTRDRNLIEEMKAEECMEIQAMSPEEGWDLFSQVAFKEEGGQIPERIEHLARQVSSQCKGLPLAINLIASSMIGNNDANKWKRALTQMQSLNFISPIAHHPRIDRDLFQRSRWSYDSLPHAHLKHCFLYCAMFPQDITFGVNLLVQMWIAEGLVNTKDRGLSYVKFLENRCLFQVEHRENVITVHDAVRDMAIYIGETKEKCVFRAGQMLQQFPDTAIDCKRISVLSNNIKSLPAKELRCQKLVTLFLGNLELKEIPEAFLHGLTYLKVLDLGGTQLKSLPLSLWQLKQLEFLNLSRTEIENLHEGTGNLSSLQFLNVSHCIKLKSLPSQIGKLESLTYFDFSNCDNLKLVPKEISRLSNCKIVQ